MTFLLLLAKIFVFPLIFILVIGVINMLVVLVARPFINVPKFPLIYNIICTLFYVFIYSLWGAYMRSIVLHYSSKLNKWILIILCLLSIFTSMKYMMKEMENEKAKMNAMDLYDSNAHKDIFSQSITVVCMSLSPFVFVSFFVFFFAEGLYQTSYFKLADSIAKLFL